MRDRFLYGIHVDFFSVNEYLSGDLVAVALAEYAHRELGTPCAHKSRDTYDLALAHVKVDIVNHLTLGIDRMISRPVSYLKLHVPDVAFALRETVSDLTSYHSLDYAALRDIIGILVERLDRASVTDDRDLISYIRYFVELM